MIGKWSACMRVGGYRVKTPAEAQETLRAQAETPTTAEITAATADVRCKRGVNYLGLVVALRQPYERQLMEQNSEPLQRLTVYYAERSKRVATVLGGSPAG